MRGNSHVRFGERGDETRRPQGRKVRLAPTLRTMHFGHYAFEVFQTMYADARERGWVTGADALDDKDVPAAILRHNLYGVDIDLRAVQLAALSLFIKAKTANPEAQIDRVNLVVADAYLPEGKVRDEFLKQYTGEPVIQQAFREVFESLNNVAQVGSLLRVEARFRQVLEAAGHPAANGGNGKKKSGAPSPQASFADLSPAWSPEYTIEQMLGHLREFARHALQEHDLNAQLFAAETEKSVALLDIFLHDYDVTVMNPPFGSPLDDAKTQLNASYEAFCNNLLCAFVERALHDFASAGIVGAVLDRTFLLKMSYERFRRKILLQQGSVIAFADLGWDVLDDANVEVCALVAAKQQDHSEGVFLRISEEMDFGKGFQSLNEMQCFTVPASDFDSFPHAAFAYWTPFSIRRMFREFPALDPNVCTAKEGIHPNDVNRFIRSHWEIDPKKVGRYNKWVHVANGGGYSPFYRDNDLLILYENDAEAIKSVRGMRGENLQFRGGITWGKRTDLISFQYLPEGYAFSTEGHSLFPHDRELLWPLLSLLNSNLIRYTTNTLCGQHKASGYIGKLPYCQPKSIAHHQLGKMAKYAYDLKASWDTGNETCTHFDLPWLLQAHCGTLLAEFSDLHPTEKPTSQFASMVDYVIAIEQAANAHLQSLQAQIDDSVYDLYEITTQDRALIERELGVRPEEIVWPYAEKLSRAQKAAEHVARFMSYFLLQAIKADPDGIIPITEGTGYPTALMAVRAGLEKQFGEAAAFQMETDAAAYLGRPLADWLTKSFWKDYHVKWYKNRPVLWQLQSQKGQFACLVYIHKLGRDTLSKVRTQYLWTVRNAVQEELESARREESAGSKSAARRVANLEAALDDLLAFDSALTDVIEARVKCNLPEWAQGPYRNGGYDPVLDDGVAVNILPLQAAGLLARKVISGQ